MSSEIVSYCVIYENSPVELAEKIKQALLPFNWRPQGGVSFGTVIGVDGIARTVWAQALIRIKPAEGTEA